MERFIILALLVLILVFSAVHITSLDIIWDGIRRRP